MYPPDPMDHVKIFKGQPRRSALWVDINNSTMLRNKISTAESCTKDQILEHKILGARF